MIDAAIIGLGRWGKGIVQSVQGKSKRLRFIRGVSKEPEQVRDFAATHGFALSTEFADAIADPRVQAVVLATPHSLHVDQIAAVAAAGKPVWCEKPLALTLARGERAVAACRKAGVVFALGNNKRCFPVDAGLRRVVAAGTIGEVLHIEAHFCNEHSTRVVPGGWRDDPAESPGGGLTGAGPASDRRAGQPRRTDRRGSCAPVRAQAAARSARRHRVAGRVRERRHRTARQRARRAGLLARACVRHQGLGRGARRDDATVALNGESPQTQTLPPADSLGVLLEAFGEAIELGTPFPVTTDEMLAVVAAFEAAIASLQSGKSVRVGS